MQRTLAAAGLLALVLAAAPSRATDAPVGTVHLSPAPGVSFDLPKNWIACDDATNKLLNGMDDPRNLRASVCVTIAGVSYNLRAFNPILFHTMSMLVAYHVEQDISPADLAALTPEIITTITPAVCDEIGKPLTTDGTKIDSCVVAVGTFGGHQALVSTVVATAPEGGDFQIDIYEVPYDKGYVQVQFNAVSLLKKITLPEEQAIMASFHID